MEVAVERFLRGRKPMGATRGAQLLADASAFMLALIAAYLIRFEFRIPPIWSEALLIQAVYIIPLEIAALYLAGVYRYVWRYVGLKELQGFVVAMVISMIPITAIRFLMPASVSYVRVPVSIIMMNAGLAFAGVLGLRLLRRTIHERSEAKRHGGGYAATKAVLLIGAGQAGVLAAREIARRGDMHLTIAGFVDDDPEKHGTLINGIEVLGTTADLPRLVAEHSVDHVIITIAQAPRREVQRIISICESVPVKARIIPGLYEILGGQVEISRIRNVEIEDLLGREPISLDDEAMRAFLSNKRVLVTGAGGSIGSELARQVAAFGPSRLLLVERAEFALFEIDQELQRRYPGMAIDPLVADTGDEARMERIFAEHRPEVVVHAAAHKHVPMMELQPSEAIKNNVLTTRLLGHIAGRHRAEAFVLISTDKAVNPTSVMGASKRVAELVIQDLSQCGYVTRFIGVRFGNVMGSAGSVIPIFRRQIAAGGPVTVTHPDMTRYFMTIPEASQLVLQAGAIGDGGEIFVLDMGEPVKIVDLATQMIRLSGLRPGEDIQITFSGVRPGEKLFEELERLEETISRTKHPKIFNGNLMPYPRAELARQVEALEGAARQGADDEVRRLLSAMLPEAKLEQVVFEAEGAEAQQMPLIGRLPIKGSGASARGAAGEREASLESNSEFRIQNSEV